MKGWLGLGQGRVWLWLVQIRAGTCSVGTQSTGIALFGLFRVSLQMLPQSSFGSGGCVDAVAW